MCDVDYIYMCKSVQTLLLFFPISFLCNQYFPCSYSCNLCLLHSSFITHHLLTSSLPHLFGYCPDLSLSVMHLCVWLFVHGLLFMMCDLLLVHGCFSSCFKVSSSRSVVVCFCKLISEILFCCDLYWFYLFSVSGN